MPSRQRTFRAEGVILRHSDWGEADRLLNIFTRETGKVRAIAKGIRKPLSRKAGHLEPFMRSNLLLARGRNLFIVTQAETVDAYLALRDDLVNVGYGSYVVELVDRFIYEEGENRILYNNLVKTLSRLNRGDNPDLVLRYYELRLLDQVGFRPQLFQCVGCKAEIKPENQFFSAEMGGVLCRNCGKKALEARPVSMRALKYLRHFQRSSYNDVVRTHFPPGVEKECEFLMQHYLSFLLERSLNSPSFLRRMKSSALEAQQKTEMELQ